MKNKLLLLFFAVALFSCSSDDNSGGTNDNNDTVNFLPQQQGNYWIYDVESDEFSGRDSLYVSGTSTSGGNTYYTYSTSELPFGFYSGLMTGGATRTSDSKLLMSGAIDAGDIFGDVIDIPSIDFADFVFFDSNASQGTNLDSNSGNFTVPYNDMDFLIEYKLTTTAGQSYPSYTVPGGEPYEDVKTVVVKVEAKIDVSLNIFIPVTFTALNNQDIVVSTQYYAKNIGMIYSDTDFQYQLNEIPIPDIELPVSESYQSNIKETLDDYWVE